MRAQFQYSLAPGSVSDDELMSTRRSVLRCFPSTKAGNWMAPLLNRDSDAVSLYARLGFSAYPMVHVTAGFDWEEEFGAKGSRLRAFVESYDFDAVRAAPSNWPYLATLIVGCSDHV